MKTLDEFCDQIWSDIDTFTRERFDELMKDRDREVRSAALRDAADWVDGFNSLMPPRDIAWHLRKRATDKGVPE